MGGTIVCAGLIEQDGRVVLVQEAKARIKGLWSLPAGRLKDHESLEECVTREVKEEAGVEAEPTGIVGVYLSLVDDNLVTIVVYDMNLLDGGLDANHHDVQDVEWVDMNKVNKLNLRSHHVKQAIEDYQERERMPCTYVEHVGDISPGLTGQLKMIALQHLTKGNIIRGAIKTAALIGMAILFKLAYGRIRNTDTTPDESEHETTSREDEVIDDDPNGRMESVLKVLNRD